VVCYALRITEVDPDRLNTLFERFVSRERNEPPDIDVDFEHERREEVIQYVYRKYSRERAALAATVISYRTKSALRDVGKALGMPLAEVDALAKSFMFWDQKLEPSNALFELAGMLRGFPRHLSQHVGGFVISRGALAELVPIENAAMPERSVIQWDKDDLEELGLLKVDVLALGMLTAIRRALRMVLSAAVTSARLAAAAARLDSSRARTSTSADWLDLTPTREPSSTARTSSTCERVVSRASGSSARAARTLASATATAARAWSRLASKSRGSTRRRTSLARTAWLSFTFSSTMWPATLALTGEIVPST